MSESGAIGAGRRAHVAAVALIVLAVAGLLGLDRGAAGAAPAPPALPCADAVEDGSFASTARLQALVRKEMGFGHRYVASDEHNKLIAWIERKLGRLQGVEVESDPFKLVSWLPRTRAAEGPGLDMGRAGKLTATLADGSARRLPMASAMHWSKPTGKKGQGGPLAYIPPEENITPDNSAGKVIIRDYPIGGLPSIGLVLLAEYITPDLSGDLAGDFERPFIHTMQADMLAAGIAGAAGVVFTFDVPREQVRSFADPHEGTIYSLPGVFAGDTEAARLEELAQQGASARVAVRAKVAKATTKNLIATLPGQSSERIVIGANTDGQSWVQENGVVGMLALARYLSELPKQCRPRTFQFVFASAHDTLVSDGTNIYAEELDAEYDTDPAAFAFAMEHFGTREILPAPDPDGTGERLLFTGKGETFLFAAGDSEVLRSTAVAVTQARNLDRTAVLQGLGLPTLGQVPPICSMGGLGNAFHRRLIPTLAMISGPWSLYAPSFGESALDYERLRSQLLAAGDAILALDGLPREQIAGDYTSFREQRAMGAPTCPEESYPQYAPGPGG